MHIFSSISEVGGEKSQSSLHLLLPRVCKQAVKFFEEQFKPMIFLKAPYYIYFHDLTSEDTSEAEEEYTLQYLSSYQKMVL